MAIAGFPAVFMAQRNCIAAFFARHTRAALVIDRSVWDPVADRTHFARGCRQYIDPARHLLD
jgi:hypothetical protein